MNFDELIEIIKDEAELGKNEPASATQITMGNIKLKKAGIPEVPADFARLLQTFNGLSNEGAAVLGIGTNSNFFPDLAEYNLQRQPHNQKSNAVILGYDDDSLYLVYNDVTRTYQVIDQESFAVEAESEEYYNFIPYLMNF